MTRTDAAVPSLDAMRAAAEPLYEQALPYHNFGHAERVLAAAERFLSDCTAAGVPVEGDVVRAAALFHDAGYHMDPWSVGASSREDYAARLAEQSLAALGAPRRFATAVAGAVRATETGTARSTVEAKVTVAADLADLAADFDRFAANADALRRERGYFGLPELSDAEWRVAVAGILAGFLADDIRVTPAHDDDTGTSVFHRACAANLARWLHEA